MSINSAFYNLKPFIPRSLQISMRRVVVNYKLLFIHNHWPILVHSDKKPYNWSGWPEGKSFALVLTHDVDTFKGMLHCDRLLRLEMDLGFRSSFNFVPERYVVSSALKEFLMSNGFEIGVHGLLHDGKLLKSRSIFQERASKINHYLKQWNAVGFRAPSMHHNLEWFNDLNIEYDSSTFDTDPFEPQSDGVGTIFPFIPQIEHKSLRYIELPYTLPQDFTLFILMQKKNIDIWKRKLDFIVSRGGMALINTHPDYMNFYRNGCKQEEYPINFYENFLTYVRSNYGGKYWHALPKDVAQFFRKGSETDKSRFETSNASKAFLK